MVKKDIGLGIKAPENKCGDKNCSWHGALPVRGRVFNGEVVKDGATGTVVVRWEYVHFVPKYERYERRHTTVVAHNPECIKAKKGDTVTIAECRPISKTKSFIVVEKVNA